jgi:hypothetical protein
MTKTYNQFKTLGHLVKKGEKSIGKNENGQSVFRLDQTLPICEPEELADIKVKMAQYATHAVFDSAIRNEAYVICCENQE